MKVLQTTTVGELARDPCDQLTALTSKGPSWPVKRTTDGRLALQRMEGTFPSHCQMFSVDVPMTKKLEVHPRRCVLLSG